MFGQQRPGLSTSNSSPSVPTFGGGGAASSGQSGGLFGQQQQPTSQLSFGAANQNQSKPLFGAGQTGAGQSNGSAAFSFGTSQPGTGQSSGSTPFSFGSNNTSNPSVQSSGTTGTSLFGSSSSNKLGGFSLGSSATQPNPVFGSTGTNTNNPFGGTNQTSAASNTGTGLFANPNSQNGFSFAKTSSAPTSSSGMALFGNTATTGQPPSGSNIFGNVANNNQPTTSASSLFGNTTGQTSGNLNSLNNSTNSLFGSSFNQYSSSGGPLIASLDQASYSLNGTNVSNSSGAGSALTPNQSLGPLTQSISSSATPTGTRSGRSSPHKAPSATRLLTPYNRNVPYTPSRTENDLRRANSSYSIRASAKIFDDLSNSLRFSHKKNEMKTLVIQRSPNIFEELTGSPSSLSSQHLIGPAESNGTSYDSVKTSSSTPSLAPAPYQNKVDDYNHSKNSSNGTTISKNSNHKKNSSQDVLFSPFARRNSTTQSKPQQPSKLSNVVHINQTATDEGYWISPSLPALYSMTPSELSHLSNLVVGRKGYGQIAWNEPVDLTTINDLSDILGNFVSILHGKIIVYPDVDSKDPIGTGINHPSTVTLENMYKVDYSTKQPIKDPSDPRYIKHISILRRNIESRGGEFLAFDANHGTWTFRVPHFSVWGLIDDEEEEEEEQEEQQVEQQRQQQATDIMEVKNREENIGNVNHSISELNGVSQAGAGYVNSNPTPFNHSVQQDLPLPNEQQLHFQDQFQNVIPDQSNATNFNDLDMNFLDQVMDISDYQDAHFAQDHQFLNEVTEPDINDWQAVDTLNDRQIQTQQRSQMPNGKNYGSDSTHYEGDDSHLQPQIAISNNQHNKSQFSDMLLDTSIVDVDEILKPKIASNWIEQLKLARSVDSTLAVDMNLSLLKHENEMTTPISLNVGSLDQLLFGGLKGLDSTITETYNKAAQTLRLPDLSIKQPLGKFSPYSGKFIFKSSSSESHVASGIKIIEEPKISSEKGQDLSPLFKQFLKFSFVENRENGAPLCSKISNIFFHNISSEMASELNSEERSMWDLCSLLFDPVNIKLPANLEPYVADKILEQQRRKNLSWWLKDCVTQSVNHDSASSKNDLERIFILLTGNKIEEACELAIKSRNLHLATLLPLLGSDDIGVKADARAQIDSWIETKSLSFIPSSIRKVYELLAGNPFIAESVHGMGASFVKNVNLCESLDWKRAFGMSLWYGTTRSEEISVAVQKYTEAFSKNEAITSPLHSDSSSSFDIRYRLLRLYGNPSPQLNSVLTEYKGSYRVAWILYQILVKSSKLFSDEGHNLGNKVIVNYAYELAGHGQWMDSIYVLSGLSNQDDCLRHVQRILCENTSNFFSDGAVKGRLTIGLGVREDLLFEAEALQARYQNNYLLEANKLLSAKLWDEAHNTVITKVAPQAVIENKIDLIIEVLSRFQYPEAILTWDIGGKVYQDYAHLVKSLNTSSIQPVDKSVVDNLISKLVGPLSRIKISSFEIKVAVTVMASFVSKHAGENFVSKMRFFFFFKKMFFN